MNTPSNREYQLGIQGLPRLLDEMIQGGLYATQTASPPARLALAASVVTNAVKKGVPVALVSTTPQRLLDRASEMGLPDVQQLLDEQRLFCFTLRTGSAQNVFRLGPQRFLVEFDHFKIPTGTLIVMDGADELITVQDHLLATEQVRCYQDWMQQHATCGLMVFSQFSSTSGYLRTFQSLLERLDGAVRLESGDDGLQWHVDFWNSPYGVTASRTLRATIKADGTLTARETVGAVGTAAPAAAGGDEDVVYGLEAALAGITRHDDHQWFVATNLVGLLHAARQAVAATVVLGYSRDTDLQQLAQAVHTLRVTLGKRVRIVVREVDASLRFQNELLLLNLGVNLIINRDVPTSRFVLTLKSLDGQVFNRDIELDFEKALASVTPSQAKGLLEVSDFLRESRSIVARSQALGLPNALVEFKLPQGTDPAAMLMRFKLTRAGDLLTRMDNTLLLFLSVCPEASLIPTLKRLAGDTVETDLPDRRLYLSDADIDQALNTLEAVATAESR